MSRRVMTTAAVATRWWVRTYTVGLDAQLRALRLAEIESDIWEQHATDDFAGVDPASTAREVFARLVAGIPDDIAWRIEHRRSRRRRQMFENMKSNGWKQTSLWILSGLLAVFSLASGAGIAIGGEDMSVAEKSLYSAGAVAAGVCVVAGFALIPRRPVWGAGLVALGGILVSAIFWWLFFVVPVVAVVVAAFAYSRARGVMALRSPGTPATP